MKRLVYIAVGTASIGAGSAALIIGCSSTGAVAIDTDAGSSDSGSGSNDSNGSGTSSGSGSSGSSDSNDAGATGTSDDASVATDAGEALDAGAPIVSNPELVSCGDSECDAGGAAFCCSRADGGMACATQANTCSRDAGGVRLECDESADCESGNACCLVVGGADGMGGVAACGTSCAATAIQLCKTDAECGSGSCAKITCFSGTRTFHACNVPSGCTP